MLLGFCATRIFKFPSWTTPALCFNNTTALPLLLIQSLHTTGILDTLLISDADNSSAAVTRAKSYFLVCAIVGNSLTFAVGPKLLDGEESPETEEGRDKKDLKREESARNKSQDAEQGERPKSQHNGDPSSNNENAEVNEQTSLLPEQLVRHGVDAHRIGYREGRKHWNTLPPWAQSSLDLCFAFFNAPLIGAAVGAILGLAPPLHRAFFNSPQEGGIFKAWLTDSISNIGELFATLQIITVGVKLSSSLRKMKRGEESGNVPWLPTLFVLVGRFVIWPV